MPSLEKFEQFAKEIELFHGLSPGDVAKIYQHGMTMQVAKGDVIFFKGTTGNQMYIVLGGKVSLFDGKKHIADLGGGDMFGEMALISSEPRSATAVAAEVTHLFVLTETFFHKLMTKRVAVQMLLNIVATLSKRLREMNVKFTRLASQP